MLEMGANLELEVGGQTLAIETGKLAGQADGAVTVRYGDTVILVTACMSDKPREEVGFLPLTVDFEERLYAAGKIPGSFFRREGKPSQEATLSARLIDRPIRPLFPKGFRNELQVIVTVLSADQENDPSVLAITGASAALGISQIPFAGPVSAVRVGYVDDQFVANPTFSQLEKSDLDLVVAGTEDAVIMVEAGAQEVSEEKVLEAIKFGQTINERLCREQKSFIDANGKPKMEFEPPPPNENLQAEADAVLREVFSDGLIGISRDERHRRTELVRRRLLEGQDGRTEQEVDEVVSEWMKSKVRQAVLEQGTRISGRSLNEIRPIECEVGILPRTHGSGLFTRGETQVLTVTTLGSPREEQILDSLTPEETKRYMHHYNFPPFSTGEVKRIGTGRREIGHGALAERALLPVIPNEEVFPYTIRLVSDVLSSNGSTSMASVCGSTLSLMDAGVPIKSPVAGIAMGLITGEDGKHAILTDIEGMEDFFGDMDFKVAGTAEGITALQMDLKLKGIAYETLETGLKQARDARLFVLQKMGETISASRPHLSRYAPKMMRLTIPQEKVGEVIGPGGRVVKSIIQDTGAEINLDPDGTVTIGAPDEGSCQKAANIVEGLIRDPQIGEVYTGKVNTITSFGAFVEIYPGKDGLLHISELEHRRVRRVEDVLSLGDEVTVKVIGFDPQGKVRLSRKALLDKPKGMPRGKGNSRGRLSSKFKGSRRPNRFGGPPRKPPAGKGRY